MEKGSKDAVKSEESANNPTEKEVLKRKSHKVLDSPNTKRKSPKVFEVDGFRSLDSAVLKVPPLKIVMPVISESETGTHHGKSGKGGNHSRPLPYVIPSSEESNSATNSPAVPPDEPVEPANQQKVARVLRSVQSRPGNNSEAGTSLSASVQESNGGNSKTASSGNSKETTASTPAGAPGTTNLPPRKRKAKSAKDESSEPTPPKMEPPFTNCVKMFIELRQQIDKKHRELVAIHPKPPQGYENYLMHKRTYLLDNSEASKTRIRRMVTDPPESVPPQMTTLYRKQEQERTKMRIQHIIEREKMVVCIEQEILRVHSRAALSLANMPLPYSACTILRDSEVYNPITHTAEEETEKERSNNRNRFSGRTFFASLRDVDDKWEKVKNNMVARHHNEAVALRSTQRMIWFWDLVRHGIASYEHYQNRSFEIDSTHVPLIDVNENFEQPND